jgi:nucleoside-diphosphate-sugar epimerase
LTSDDNELKNTVALIGANGNLGQALKRNLERFDFTVLSVLRPGSAGADAICVPHETILGSRMKPNLVINASNFYAPSITGERQTEMYDSIVGVAKAIAIKNAEWRVPIVSFSSYFQFAPSELKPWSLYSELKDEAFDLLALSTSDLNVKHWDFTLYDTYGGTDRDKFLDKLVRVIRNSEAMDATLGQQEINLTHIEDIGRNLALFFRAHLDGSFSVAARRYQIKHPITHSLRSLANLAENSLAKKLPISWGALPYRDKEVFKLWEIDLPIVEGFSHYFKLEEYFSSLKP